MSLDALKEGIRNRRLLELIEQGIYDKRQREKLTLYHLESILGRRKTLLPDTIKRLTRLEGKVLIDVGSGNGY